MKYLRFLLLLILQTNACVLAAEVKHNFEVRIAVVDVQSILENSIAITGVRKAIDIISQDIQKYLGTKELEFKTIEEELVKKRGILSEESFEREFNNFNKKVSDAQKEMQTRKAKLEQAHAGAISKVHEVTMEIINELARKYNFNIALPSSQVLFATSDLNITSEVISLLNNRLKNVKVNY